MSDQQDSLGTASDVLVLPAKRKFLAKSQFSTEEVHTMHKDAQNNEQFAPFTNDEWLTYFKAQNMTRQAMLIIDELDINITFAIHLQYDV